MAESAFLRTFPAQQGYGLLLVDVACPDGRNGRVHGGGRARGLRRRRAPDRASGSTSTTAWRTRICLPSRRSAALGLLLGTVGVAAVLLRNVLERRRELALLGAVGYGPPHFLLMAFVENVMLVGGGLLVGGACAWVAVAPGLVERGARAPIGAGGLVLLLAVLVTGLISARGGQHGPRTATPLLESLRSE